MPKGQAITGTRATTNRRQILDILAKGPISDQGGLAIQQLQALTGHETSNALTKVLRQMENLGLIRRVIKGRRTFYIESLVTQTNEQNADVLVSELPGGSPRRGVADLVAAVEQLRTENGLLRSALEVEREQSKTLLRALSAVLPAA